MGKSFRLQLTGWYLLIFALLLAFFSGFLYMLLSRNLRERLDESLADKAVTTAGLFQSEVTEHNGELGPAAEEALRELSLHGTGLAIFAGPRRLAARGPEFLGDARVSSLLGAAPVYRTFPDVGRRGARLLVRPFQAGGQNCYVAAAESLDSVAGQLEALRRVFYVALPVAFLLAGLGGYLLAAKSLAPIVAMAGQAEQITARNLHTRLEVRGAKAEFSRLAAVFNDLLSRLESSFAGMREFVADASHELRTPLAVIRGEADVALSRNRLASEYRESLSTIQDEARRLSRLVDDLLSLARADAGHRPVRLEEFYLNELMEECFRAAQPLARIKLVHLGCSCAGDIAFRGDPELLRRMVMNLLDNAIRYTPAGGSATLSLEALQGEARIAVADTGAGIPPDCRDRVFERFYRVDKARSRAEGGFGLGLAIVKWIAESHQGRVSVAGRPEGGSTFTVLLPLASATRERAPELAGS
jgi:heavy metal sensor kinase